MQPTPHEITTPPEESAADTPPDNGDTPPEESAADTPPGNDDTPPEECADDTPPAATGATPARSGRGGPGRKPAANYVPGSGQVPDLTKKHYNKGSRAVIKAFDAVAYAKSARRKANAVDSFFGAAQAEKIRAAQAKGANVPDSNLQCRTTFQPSPPAKKYRHRGHERLNLHQEFLVTMMFVRHECDFGKLMLWWLGDCKKVSTNAIRNIVYTWVAFLHSIFQFEPLWISTERADQIRPSAFKSAVADHVQHMSDCTNVNVGGCQVSSPLAAALLRSEHYKTTCGRHDCSPKHTCSPSTILIMDALPECV